MKVTCQHCKAEIEECPHCGEEIDHKLTLPVILLLIGLFMAIFTGMRWQARLDDHEEAMRKRAVYLRSNPDALRLPIGN